MCILDHIEINLIYLDVAQILSSNKAFPITRFCTVSFGKLFLSSVKLLEEGEKFFYCENEFSH